MRYTKYQNKTFKFFFSLNFFKKMKLSITFKTLLLLILLFTERIYAREEAKNLNLFLHGSHRLKKTYKNDVDNLKSETTALFNSGNTNDLEISIGVALIFKPFGNWPDLKKLQEKATHNKNFDISTATEEIKNQIGEKISSFEAPAATLGVTCIYGNRMGKTKSFKCKLESSLKNAIEKAKEYYNKVRDFFVNKYYGGKKPKSDANNDKTSMFTKMRNKVIGEIIKYLLKKAVKYGLAALFPPIAPLIAIWDIFSSLHASVTDAGNNMKKIEISYELFDLIGIATFQIYLAITVNIEKLKRAYYNMKNWLKNKWDALKKVYAYYKKSLKLSKSDKKYYELVEESITEVDDENGSEITDIEKDSENNYDCIDAGKEAAAKINFDVENDANANQKEITDFEEKLRNLEALVGPDNSISEETTNERQPLLAIGKKKKL